MALNSKKGSDTTNGPNSSALQKGQTPRVGARRSTEMMSTPSRIATPRGQMSTPPVALRRTSAPFINTSVDRQSSLPGSSPLAPPRLSRSTSGPNGVNSPGALTFPRATNSSIPEPASRNGAITRRPVISNVSTTQSRPSVIPVVRSAPPESTKGFEAESTSPVASEATHTPNNASHAFPTSPSHNASTESPSGHSSPVGSIWAPTSGFDDDDDLITEVDGNAPDEEFLQTLQDVGSLHTRQLMRYKRLLQQSQLSTASQLHAMQAETKLLREQLQLEREGRARLEARMDTDREHSNVGPRNHTPQPYLTDLPAIIRGSVDGTVSDSEVKAVIRTLKSAERMRLTHTILDSCFPGDISAMIRLLEKYLSSIFDIVGSLPEELGVRILCELDVLELLSVEPVSRTWSALVRHSSIWRYHCLRISASDPVPLRPPDTADGWETLYRGLHHRERNWSEGLAQSVTYLKGHTGFVTTLLLKGKRLISGSYDETIRVWDLDTGTEKKVLRAKAISCLDFLPEEEVFAAGFHDVGRVQVFSSITWNLLQTLQGHLYGIRAIVMNSRYLVSAGADKALVCWDWRAGTKLVRFGQQTNLNIGIQLLDNDRLVSVTIDGFVRMFSISGKEMLSQFKLSDLEHGDPAVSSRLLNVGVGSNMLQWFAAKGSYMTCATKSVILHLEWLHREQEVPETSPPPRSPVKSLSGVQGLRTSQLGKASPRRDSLTRSTSSIRSTNSNASVLGRPPRLLAIVDTPDISVGAVDPTKGRVVTSTRFSSRAGADRRIFVSTHRNASSQSMADKDDDNGFDRANEAAGTPIQNITPMTGVWEATPDLAVPEKNPMAMTLDHERACIGCADGTIYILGFVGHVYPGSRQADY